MLNFHLFGGVQHEHIRLLDCRRAQIDLPQLEVVTRPARQNEFMVSAGSRTFRLVTLFDSL